MKLVSAESAMDPQLLKAESLRQAGGTSVITYLGMGRKFQTERGGGSQKSERNSRNSIKVRGREDIPGDGARICFSCHTTDDFPDRNFSLSRANTRVEKKCVKEVVLRKKCCVLTVTSHPPLCCSGMQE